MAQREKISIGPFGVQAEGTITTLCIVTLLAVGLGAAFYLGKLSTLMDACFGLPPYR